MRDIRILPAVLMDLAEAAAWYDREGHPGLGDRFINTFYTSLPKIEKNGESYRMAYQDFRKIIIRPFPYSVYFRLHDEMWIVTLAVHAARNPDFAKGILEKRR
ncbi:MAG: type II toxin-antitoxin system RelE/ParE family toxin [Luteolibacter sp.]|uniref:type II toxin-antitoxin system RelE/ParE family toxin n=1 Tax=Luteolibacter sp. TaxID=1962973 RepID=UPI003266053D